MSELPPDATMHRSPGPRAAIGAVRWYQRWISPVLPPSCRFHPSCSAYAVDAYAVHGVIRGTGLTVWRLLRCGPWHPGGADPVPPRRRAPVGSPDPPDAASTEPTRTEGL